jgi:hypothetical protein
VAFEAAYVKLLACDAGLAHRYSRVRDYVSANRAAVREMHRRVGGLRG